MDKQPKANLVTLNDILRLVLPLNTKVIGRFQSGHPLVNWVVILTDLTHLAEQIQPGDLVLIPPTLMQELEEHSFIEFITILRELSTSAVILFDPVTKEIEKAAVSAYLPLFIIMDQSSIREIHRGLVALLLDRQKQITERGLQLYRRLTEMSREGQGLEAMTEIISKLTGKIVAIQDKRLEIRAISFPADNALKKETIHKILSNTDHLPSVLRNRKAVARAREKHWQQDLFINDEKVARLISPIISGDRARGYLSLLGPPDTLDLLDILSAEHGAAAYSMEMAKVKAISEAKKALRGNFLEALLAGTLPEAEMERLAGRLDHITDRPHIIITLAWLGNNPPSLRRMETTINWLLTSHEREALSHVYSDDHICIFQALDEKDKDLDTIRRLTKRIRDHLKAEHPKERLVGGVSGIAKSLPNWPTAYRQAVQSMEIARRLELAQFVEFKNLGIYQLLTQLDNVPSVGTFCDQLIGPLARYDQQHQSDLIQTITAYFDHHANISQTAESLFIHRNTLLYRLERIQDLTKQDLNQSEARLALHLAIKLWQLRPESKPPKDTSIDVF